MLWWKREGALIVGMFRQAEKRGSVKQARIFTGSKYMMKSMLLRQRSISRHEQEARDRLKRACLTSLGMRSSLSMCKWKLRMRST